MAKSLIITEKPSVAFEFAKVLNVSGKKDGYIENSEYVITWCIGHLVGLVYPEEYDSKYKKWRLEDLPFLPQEYKYNVIKEVKKQYDIVQRMPGFCFFVAFSHAFTIHRFHMQHINVKNRM